MTAILNSHCHMTILWHPISKLTLYPWNSNFSARIRCYKIKVAESSKHRWNTISPSQSNEQIWHQLYIGAEDEKRSGAWHMTGWERIWAFPAAVKRLSRACTIAKRNALLSYLALLMAYWKHFCLISLFHGRQTCHEHENCLPFHDGLEISRMFKVWGRDRRNFANWKVNWVFSSARTL